MRKRPPNQTETIFSTFESVWPDLYRFVTQTLFPKMVMLECMYVRQALDILEGLFPNEDDNKELQPAHTQKLIVFAVMWSLGALLELDDRKKVTISFDPTSELYRNLTFLIFCSQLEDFLRKHDSNLPLPSCEGEDTIFEFVVSDSGDWEHWKNRVCHT